MSIGHQPSELEPSPNLGDAWTLRHAYLVANARERTFHAPRRASHNRSSHCAQDGVRTRTTPEGPGGLSPLRLPIPPPGPCSTVPGPTPLHRRRLRSSKLTRVVDSKPQRSTSPVGFRTRQVVRHHHTLDHVGNHRRPRAALESHRHSRHPSSTPQRPMDPRKAGR